MTEIAAAPPHDRTATAPASSFDRIADPAATAVSALSTPAPDAAPLATARPTGAISPEPVPQAPPPPERRNRAPRRALRPHSRLLRTGRWDQRSAEGKYLAAIEYELSEHVGGAPTIGQRLLIRRAGRATLQLELLDGQLPRTEHDLRLASSLENRLRLILRELGLKPAAAKPPGATLADVMREIDAEKGAAA